MESKDLPAIIEALKHAVATMGVAFGGVKTLRHLFRAKDIPACNSRIMHDGRGFPWNAQVAVHPLPDGRVKITPIVAKKK